jgi:hypothetical protein
MLGREDLERREQEMLAPYAVKSAHAGGRVYPEEEHPLRLAFQRDRDRIVHSTAFRRLEYKTQVFVNHEGDHFRTRLTHTLEVAQIARTIARSLGLNEDLTEAIALAHDLGHPPFGHAGERAMHEMMRPYGGFEHNQQSLRIVEVLEERYHRTSQKIESYCVDCEMEAKYQAQIQNSSQIRRKIVKKLSGKLWALLMVGMLIILFLPVHMIIKFMLCFLLLLITLKLIFDPFLSQPPGDRKPDWDDIRAKALNQSSIQANEVANVKRQWKKGFLQEHRNKDWTEEDWQQYLNQHYKKE